MPAIDTDFPADSVEFCPHPDASDIFVCGTYKLDQAQLEDTSDDDEQDRQSPSTMPGKQHRTGECLLFRVDDQEQPLLLQKTPLPAILDMKWCSLSPSVAPTLAIADSEGGITLHEYQRDESALNQVVTIPCASKDVLCLSLDWSSRLHPSTSLGSLVVSLSNGSLALLRADDGGGMSVTDTWVAHDHEPWIAAWNYWDTNVIYSGGDDLKMKGWDIREGFSQPIFTNKRFDAGVTTIQSHPYIENLLAVGSYDNTVRLFDTRKPLTPLTLAEVGGGAWRVKWHPSPSRQNDLLVACMHDGFKVVRFNFDSPGNLDMASPDEDHPQQWRVVSRFDEHKSLAYGVDWCAAKERAGGEDNTLIASCSFYDHTLHMWRG